MRKPCVGDKLPRAGAGQPALHKPIYPPTLPAELAPLQRPQPLTIHPAVVTDRGGSSCPTPCPWEERGGRR